ncbi:CRISPR-associated Cse2 family protein [Companilactobacillus paralimentarius DSM 13238 = JCM 10415]|uniref:CRISPR-associated Cse2 family protein n=1 Tax=Companilactobacillus paralimentarius DSM 13238 = JCM 10415 TaxID=1122151 RepID=A0A0R1P8H7_9LACO|nr:type I-E CRISPR-associated protein Cse2/CasB [Companilactobacillus paralimentarius]KAE9564830.1 type I-E CRISPR-associated protein Cse2/CasB [Companilactobacillus paralimentarius]KAE9565539.1 type I-E CRISPR-associated protein Cse2/CasB [Companilactobacillus paralimentarius]KRL28791.1 CRISPR-associated Cse2 family protein [Companilactobacillus paralimentarius DSM 13238 = JCM 10415]QFR68521.1 type I-E CRISPR-associated protein Cse2/CasB [Companilactobacillus paralimentarius]
MGKIEKVTDRVIRSLWRDGKPDKAVLSNVRGAATLLSRQAQSVWPVMMANLDEKMLSRDGRPTYAETAVYAAIRFYAIHQQGQTQFVYSSVHGDDENKGVSLFKALAQLRNQPDRQEALDRRVKALLATSNVASMIQSLSHSIKIDYALLAQDLYDAQFGVDVANQVHLRWGQQYYWSTKNQKTTEGEKN